MVTKVRIRIYPIVVLQRNSDMKCIYYLSPTLLSTHSISKDLQAIGLKDWFVHVVSKNEAGLNKEHLHSSNYLETLDLIREGLIGATCGFLLGLVLAFIFKVAEPFGPNVPLLVYAGILLVCSGFGAWLGGLNGIAHENKKLARFHDQIEAGFYLVLIYAREKEEQKIIEMMKMSHPETQHVGFDTRFYNPFSRLQLVG